MGGIEKSLQTKWLVTHSQWTSINWTTCCGLENLQIFPGQFNRQFVPQILNLFLNNFFLRPVEGHPTSAVVPHPDQPMLWPVNKIVQQGKTKALLLIQTSSDRQAEYVNHKLENSCKTVVRQLPPPALHVPAGSMSMCCNTV